MDAVRQVIREVGDIRREVEMKKYAKVEKVAGGVMQACPFLGVKYCFTAFVTLVYTQNPLDLQALARHAHRSAFAQVRTMHFPAGFVPTCQALMLETPSLARRSETCFRGRRYAPAG